MSVPPCGAQRRCPMHPAPIVNWRAASRLPWRYKSSALRRWRQRGDPLPRVLVSFLDRLWFPVFSSLSRQTPPPRRVHHCNRVGDDASSYWIYGRARSGFLKVLRIPTLWQLTRLSALALQNFLARQILAKELIEGGLPICSYASRPASRIWPGVLFSTTSTGSTLPVMTDLPPTASRD